MTFGRLFLGTAMAYSDLAIAQRDQVHYDVREPVPSKRNYNEKKKKTTPVSCTRNSHVFATTMYACICVCVNMYVYVCFR